jgi:excinuclease ABC subunit C
MKNAEGEILYVGKAKNLKKRVSSYFMKQNQGVKTKTLVEQIADIEITVTRSETEALLLESNLIKSLRPKYNVLMRDDKSYPYIHVNEHTFPRMEMYRSKRKPKKGEFYGPFTSSTSVKTTLNTIQKLFKIRNCRDSYFAARSRPCLQYQIKRCSAPCVNYISEQDYAKSVDNARRFLQGKCEQIINELTVQMEEAVSDLAFEVAAKLRDQIKLLRMVQEQQGMVQLRGDADALAIEAKPGFACIQLVTIRNGELLHSQSFFPSVPNISLSAENEQALHQAVFEAFVSNRYFEQPERIPQEIITDAHVENKEAIEQMLTELRTSRCRLLQKPKGNKRRWLDFAHNNLQLAIRDYQQSAQTMVNRYQDLEKLLNRHQPIHRMECFDISHSSGEATIASCVVFDRQGPRKSDYRRFNIEGITKGDDFAAMNQALTRRYRRLVTEDNLPDVLIIDGGKGQVNVALKVLAELGIEETTVLGVAKGPERKAGWERLILADTNIERTLPENSPALHLLQQIRDEAHRFAITSHRRKRDKSRFESSLESIEGIGAKRRQALLKRFGGIRDVSSASMEEISKVPGISQALAERIYHHFHR